MYSVLDAAGAILYFAYRIIILPVLLLLGVFFGVLLAIKYTNTAYLQLRSIKLGRLVHAFHFIKPLYSHGNRVNA